MPGEAKGHIRLWRRDLARILAIVGGVWAFALALVMFLGQPNLNPMEKDQRQLLAFMGTSGTGSILAAYFAYRLGLINRFRLRYTLIFVSALTIALFFINFWVTAQLMLVNEHDVGLTSILLVFSGGTALGFGYFIANALTERIGGVADGAKQLSGGDLAARVAVRGNDELAELAATFNVMAERLQAADAEQRALEQTRRDLIAWASHDLRTPLASLRLVIDALNDGVVDDPATVGRYLQTARSEVDNLNRLINDLFELAQMDAGHLDLHPERASLNDLISDTLSTMRAMADQRGVSLRGEVKIGVDPVTIDAQKIQRVLSNLIMNAIRHTPSGGAVTLTAVPSGDCVRVAVQDTGEGIPAADLPRIFERFYRGERARTREEDGQRGAGLGLAIVRGLVEAHGGQINVQSEPGKGTLFTFTLPRSTDSAP
jgi:signal transduction histidine kinase